MKYILLFFITIFFTACSSKNDININKQMKSFSINDTVVIDGVPKTVKSPISIGLGLGGYIANHVGVRIATKIIPDIPNTDSLNIQKGIAIHHIPLENLVLDEFYRQIVNDEIYKDKIVPFGADFTINLYVNKYDFDSSIISGNTAIKIDLELEIVNKNFTVIYKDKKSSDVKVSKYSKIDVLNDKELLIEVLNSAIADAIARLIIDMKKS